MLLANLLQGTRFFASQVLTVRAVFPEVALLPVKGKSNVVVAAAKSPAAGIRLGLATLGPDDHARYRPYGVDLAEIAQRVVHERDYLPQLSGRGMVLTDDFAPVESLDRDAIPKIEPRPP